MENEQKKKRKRRKDPAFIIGLVLLIIGVGFLAYAGGVRLYASYLSNSAVDHYLGGMELPSDFSENDGSGLPDAGDTSIFWDGAMPDDSSLAELLANAPMPDAVLGIPKLELLLPVYKTEYMSEIYKHMHYGAGLYPKTAPPGTKGNMCMAAHRTGPSDFFRDLDKLEPGDFIFVYSGAKAYKYEVEFVKVIKKNDWSVVQPLDYAAVTLTTCQAYGGVSNARRLVVRANMVGIADLIKGGQ